MMPGLSEGSKKYPSGMAAVPAWMEPSASVLTADYCTKRLPGPSRRPVGSSLRKGCSIVAR